MPMYDYRCKACGARFEAWQKFTDDPISVCPTCSGPAQRVIHAAGIMFKGSGFYITDSKGSGAVPAASEASEKSDASASSASETGASTSSASESPTKGTKESKGSKDAKGSQGSTSSATSTTPAAQAS